jgi:UDP-N-acetylmuramoylalanine--D-glutamate ligase
VNLNNMKGLEKLQNKNIGFIGFGIENQALLAWLQKHKVTATYTFCDNRTEIENKTLNVNWRLGENYLAALNDFDIIFRSPGCPLFLPELQAVKEKISSAMNLFMEECPTKNIIGITGSKGKGTTSSLIYSILKEAKKSVYLGGNIGVAPFTFIDEVTEDSYVVLELSSFQLEDFKISPRYSILTNLFHEHLEPADPNNPNYHKTFEDYKAAKLNIAKFPENELFLTHTRLADFISGDKVKYFNTCDYPSKLAGEFNKENIAAAVMLAEFLKIDEKIIKKAVANFNGLPHRLEKVAEINGVTYYDNSFSTTPESTIADIKSFPGAIMLMGGADKGADFKELAKEIAGSVNFVILFKGDATARLKMEIIHAGLNANRISIAGSMEEAVKKASKRAEEFEATTVLLSTACASFGLFKNYKERGDLFQKYVKELK